MMGDKIVFGMVLITIVTAGIPNRNFEHESTYSQYNDDSLNKLAAQNENTKGDTIDKDPTIKAPQITRNEPNAQLIEDVVAIGPIFEGLDEKNTETRKGKHIVQDARDNQGNYKESVGEPFNRKKENVDSPLGRYEITENIIDIPDDRTVAGPVIFNYTKFTPLNLGGTRNETENKTPEPEEVEDDKTVRSRISILHIKAEIDDNSMKKENKITTFFKGVKKYISGIKNGVVDGISKLFSKHDTDSKEKSLDDADHKSLDDSVDYEEDADSSDENDDDFKDFHKSDDDFDGSHENVDDFGQLHKTIHDDIHSHFN